MAVLLQVPLARFDRTIPAFDIPVQLRSRKPLDPTEPEGQPVAFSKLTLPVTVLPVGVGFPAPSPILFSGIEEHVLKVAVPECQIADLALLAEASKQVLSIWSQ